MRIKRVHWLVSCLLCVVMAFCASACANEMPQIDGELEQNDYPPTYQEDVIDMELYELSSVNTYSREMLNLPGMLLITDQRRGATLYYINKATGKGHIFCFDPLCNHKNCPASQIMLVRKCGYHPKDNALYYSIGKATRMGTEVYRLDLETFESKVVWKSDGNLLMHGFEVFGDYLVFMVARTEGGYDAMLLNVTTGDVIPIQPPSGKVFQSFTVINGKAYATFTDSSAYYRLDASLSYYNEVDVPVRGTYFDDNVRIGKLMGEQEIRGLAYGNIVGFEAYEMQSGKRWQVYKGEVPLYHKGFDGEYVYYTEYEKKGESYVENPMLYRVSVWTGEVEELCEITGYLMEVVEFEDTVYYCHKVYVDSSPQFCYGKLVKTEDGFVAEDFEIEYP